MPRLTSITKKGQVTIPKEVRDALGLKPFEKIEVTVIGSEARLRKVRASLNEIAGSLPPLEVKIEDMPTVAKEERATRLREKLVGGPENESK